MADSEYQNKAFWPISVSQEAPESILCSILKVASSKDRSELKKRLFWDKRNNGALYLLKIYEDDPAINEWVSKNFTYKTKENQYLLPIHASAAFTAKEPYDTLFEQLMRAGRPEDRATEILAKFIEYFKSIDNIDDINTKLYIDLSKEEFLKDEGTPKGLKPDQYKHFILCQPHARLFQNDISSLLDREIPRRELLELVFSIVSFHLCAYLVRMSLCVAKQDQALRTYSMAENQRIYGHKCYSCLKKYNNACSLLEENELNDYLLDPENCMFNRLFEIGNNAQANYVFNCIKQFSKRMFLFNKLNKEILYSNADPFETMGENYYRKIEGKKDIIDEIEKSMEKTSSWDHPIGFFRNLVNNFDYGINNRTKQIKESYSFCLSDSLLKGFVSNCCYNEGADEVFVDKFLEFLWRRGISFLGDEKDNLMEQLKQQDLLTILEDAGAAICVKDPYNKRV